MPSLPTLILILGVSLGVTGAAGFGDPPKEGAYLLFALGIGCAIAGGLMAKRQAAQAEGGMTHESAAVGDLAQRLESIAIRVQTLEQTMGGLAKEEFTREVDDILRGEYFELGNRADDYVGQLGFARYAQVWDGVASAERLLARAWSVATDGFLAEAREEITHVRGHLQRSVQAVEAL